MPHGYQGIYFNKQSYAKAPTIIFCGYKIQKFIDKFYALNFLKNIVTWNFLCKALTVSDKSINLSDT